MFFTGVPKCLSNAYQSKCRMIQQRTSKFSRATNTPKIIAKVVQNIQNPWSTQFYTFCDSRYKNMLFFTIAIPFKHLLTSLKNKQWYFVTKIVLTYTGRKNCSRYALSFYRLQNVFVPVQIFWVSPKIWLYLVPLQKLLCWPKNQFYWM